jgi:predicted nucleic acid-binding protein
MILVDTSVWVDHLRASDEGLKILLHGGHVLVHPFVVGELALGHLRQRERIIGTLQDLPQADIATDQEVLQFIGRHALFGFGIGYVDAHLLAAARLASAHLWTRDKRLLAAANTLKLSAPAPPETKGKRDE